MRPGIRMLLWKIVIGPALEWKNSGRKNDFSKPSLFPLNRKIDSQSGTWKSIIKEKTKAGGEIPGAYPAKENFILCGRKKEFFRTRE